MERKLASVQKIISTSPIEGADRIEIANILGWQCVTQKSNEFKPGDLVCYFEIDSLIPLTHTHFEFLRKKVDQSTARIKTIKLKGKFAQGLILPLPLIAEVLKDKGIDVAIFNEDDDLTEALGVTKWEPEIAAQLAGQVVGQFPSFVSKTDETRIQSCPSVLEKHKGTRMYATEKIDGSSITVFYVNRNQPGLPSKYLETTEDEWIFGVCSRNLCLQKTEGNAYWKAVENLGLEEKLKAYGKPIVLQGELFGIGIQKNKLGRPSIEINWFNVGDPTDRTMKDKAEAFKILAELDLKPVPVIHEDIELNFTVDELVVMSMGKSVYNPTVWREGLVFRPLIEQEVRHLGRFSFKVINPEFSVKYDE